MHLSNKGSVLALVTLASNRPYIYVGDAMGARLAELFVLSSVHPLHGRDDTVRTGRWRVEETEDQVVFALDAESSVWMRKTYRLRDSVRRMLGMYSADGFKIDFTARIPNGPSLRRAGDAWGLELMKQYLTFFMKRPNASSRMRS